MKTWIRNYCGTHCALTVFSFKNSAILRNPEGRSANKEIEQYLKKRVAEYEKEFGKIEVDKDLL